MVDLPAPGIPVKQTISFVNNKTKKLLVYEGTGNYYRDVKRKLVMRTFVAVEISDEQVMEEISKFQSELDIDAKRVEPQNLHFTLQFLGEISKEMSEEVCELLKKIEFSNFTINFRGIGVFPESKFPRIIWIGVDEKGGNALIDLAKKVENALTSLGFRSDKPFKPHITVFRIKNKIEDITKKLQMYESVEFGSQKITNFKFKQSVLTPNGPVYSNLMETRGV